MLKDLFAGIHCMAGATGTRREQFQERHLQNL